jgi:tetrapyrrole methylase family protein/MazG family protein
MAEILVVGLGPGSVDSIPLGVYNVLKEKHPLYIRTERHPVVDWLVENRIPFQALDHFYETAGDFETVYQTIGQYLFEQAVGKGKVVYAVPGHPVVAERTTQILYERAEEHGIPVRLGPGHSFLDEMLLKLRMDPVEGLMILDATSFRPPMFNPMVNTIFLQVYHRDVASDVKLGLMEQLPDEYPVVVARAVGVPGEEQIVSIPLYELDRVSFIDHLTSVFVPQAKDDTILSQRWEQLEDVVARLRSPEGCPWDREQTHRSLRRYVIEEAYEVADAIDRDDPWHLCEELGDLLLQVMLHTQIAAEEGTFTLRDCVSGLTRKLIRRHPHVFGDATVTTAAQVEKTWQKIKESERKSPSGSVSLLDDVPSGLSGLLAAFKIQQKAATVGFDWNDVRSVIDKIKEELEEVEGAEDKAAELGDLLFAAVNLCRFYQVDPEEAIARTNAKFRHRFRFIEQSLQKSQLTFADVDLGYLDKLWNQAKENE